MSSGLLRGKKQKNNKIADLMGKLDFYRLIPYPMDRQGPPNRPRYQLTRGLNRLRQQKRCYDITLSRQEGNMMHRLENAQWDRPASILYTGRLFMLFGGPVCADRISNCPLDGVLPCKSLVYLSNLQFELILTDYIRSV